MIYGKLLVALAFSATFAEVAWGQGNRFDRGGFGRDQGGDNGGNNQEPSSAAVTTTTAAADAGNTGTATTDANGGNGGNGGNQAVLDPNNIQKASAQDGQGQVSGVKDGQAPSATDPANFLNFCTGEDLTNGEQKKGGSCNGIPMGRIPATTNMVSTIILNPKPGECITAKKTFTVNLQVDHLKAGVFTNPTVTYYSAPQDLENGDIIGHVHVTIQALGDSLAPQVAPDANTFAFFKGIDDAGNNNGGLSAQVPGGLPAGNFRICTMSSAANHQPVIMPIAQRGSQDDCTKMLVSENCDAEGGNTGGNTGDGNNGSSASAGNGAATTTTAAAGGTAETTTAAGAATSSTSTADGANQDNQDSQGNPFGTFGQGGRRRFGQRRHRFQTRPWVV